MSNNNNNNNNRKHNQNENEIEKMGQKGQVGQKPNGSCNGPCDDSMKKGSAQGQQNKPIQQGKPAQGQHQGGQKPTTSGNGDIKKYSTHQEDDKGLETSSAVESNKKNKGW